MSYILDALKKSQQQRRTQPALPATASLKQLSPDRSVRKPHYFAAATAICALLVAGVTYLPLSDTPTAAVSTQLPAALNTTRAPASTVASAKPALTVAEVQPQLASQLDLEAQQAAIRDQMQQYVAAAAPAIPAANVAEQPSPNPEALAAPSSVPPTINAADSSPEGSSDDGEENTSTTETEQIARTIPFLDQLPAILSRLPELEVSVSIYSRNPDDRRARINGTMFYEGDAIDTRLVLTEIRPRALVFSFEDQKFQMRP